MRTTKKVLVTGLPLLPEAEALLCQHGCEVFVTNPKPDQAEMLAQLRNVHPVAMIVRVGQVDRDCFEAAPSL